MTERVKLLFLLYYTHVVGQFGVVHRVRGGVVVSGPGAQLVARQQTVGRLELQVVVFAERLQPDLVRAVRVPFGYRVQTDHLVRGHCGQKTVVSFIQ